VASFSNAQLRNKTQEIQIELQIKVLSVRLKFTHIKNHQKRQNAPGSKGKSEGPHIGLSECMIWQFLNWGYGIKAYKTWEWGFANEMKFAKKQNMMRDGGI